jgi:hypothetical protein
VLEAEILQGRKIGYAEIAEIAALIEANPRWSRWRLSQEVAQKWEWYSASGQLKDMAARTLLLKLHVTIQLHCSHERCFQTGFGSEKE